MATANLSINLSLFKSLPDQLAALDQLLPQLASRGITLASATISAPRSTTSHKPDVVGENEAAWLAFSGRKRMNMKDRSLSREEQAKLYLEEKGLKVPNPDCLDSSDNESIQDDSTDSENSDDDSDDPFIPKII
jgi:hypothetical protein